MRKKFLWARIFREMSAASDLEEEAERTQPLSSCVTLGSWSLLPH